MNILPLLSDEAKCEIEAIMEKHGVTEAGMELAGLYVRFRFDYRHRNKLVREAFQLLKQEYPKIRRWVVIERLSRDFYLSRRHIERICRGL